MEYEKIAWLITVQIIMVVHVKSLSSWIGPLLHDISLNVVPHTISYHFIPRNTTHCLAIPHTTTLYRASQHQSANMELVRHSVAARACGEFHARRFSPNIELVRLNVAARACGEFHVRRFSPNKWYWRDNQHR